MSNTSTKVALVAACVAIAGIGAYWHYSPYLAIKQMRTAAEQKDADTFNAHVDYPRLRESFKGQVAAMMTERMASAGSSSGELEGLGAALGLALINPLIDAMVRPEMVMHSMQEGKFKPLPGISKEPTNANTSEPAKEPKWEYERKGSDKLIAYAVDPEGKEDARIGVVFERSGFANWKLTEIRLPAK